MARVGQLDGEELEKLRQLVDKLDHNHLPSFEEMHALRTLIATDELRSLLERDRINRLWVKVRLQLYRIIAAMLATLAAAGAAWTFVETLYRKFAGT